MLVLKNQKSNLKTKLTLVIFLSLALLLFSCDNGVPVNPNYPPTPPSQTTLYTVSFNSQNGSTIDSQTIERGSTATKPTPPTKENYIFVDWYTDSATTTLFDFNTPITRTITLYAKWDTPIVVTFDSQDGSAIPSQTIISNSTASEPITLPTKDRYGFAGWYTDSTTTTQFYFTNLITSNTTIYVKWESNPFTVTFDSQGGTTISQQIIAQGSTARKRTPTKKGYRFNDWHTDSTTSTPFDFNTPITSAITLYAKWRIKPANKQELIDIITPAISANPNTNLNHIDTSLIIDMSQLFHNKSVFNGDISQWNTSQVTNMSEMFSYATIFNQPLNNWDTSQVTDMSLIFANAEAFNQPISNWNTSKVTSMRYMFAYAYTFNQPIGNWNTSKLTSMNGIFQGAEAFNQPIGNWNTSKVTSMRWVFYNATAFNQNISSWNTFQATSMDSMFREANSFNQSISNWNTSQVIDMRGMFSSATNFNQPISNWNTSQVTDMKEMFSNATAFNQPINNWNTFQVKNMNAMFYNATAFNQDIGNWNTSKVTNMNEMFYGSALKNNKPNWCSPNKCD